MNEIKLDIFEVQMDYSLNNLIDLEKGDRFFLIERNKSKAVLLYSFNRVLEFRLAIFNTLFKEVNSTVVSKY